MRETVIERLEKAVDDGFLLHGSNTNTEVLKPFKNQRSDLHSKNKPGVYATDSPAKALWFATLPAVCHSNFSFKGKRGIKRNQIGHGVRLTIREQNYPFAVAKGKVIKERTSGFVYILPAESFEPYMYDEFYSSKEITPAEIIPVEKDDFTYPIIEISSEDEALYFLNDSCVGFGNGDIRTVYLTLPNRKKLRCRVRELGISEIKELLKEKRGRRVSNVDKLNLGLLDFSFVDDFRGDKPDIRNRKIPISFLWNEDFHALQDAAYPLPVASQ